MSADEQPAQLILQIDAADADDAERDDLARQLQIEIAELGVESVDEIVTGSAPGGTKSAEAVMLGAMVVTALPTVVPGVIGLIRDWLSRGRNQNVKITARLGDQEISIEYPPTPTLQLDLERLLGALNKPASVSQSGGVNLEAGQVGIEGDVTGRDKIISAGGHIVYAEQGATVIIGQETSPGETKPIPTNIVDSPGSDDTETSSTD